LFNGSINYHVEGDSYHLGQRTYRGGVNNELLSFLYAKTHSYDRKLHLLTKNLYKVISLSKDALAALRRHVTVTNSADLLNFIISIDKNDQSSVHRNENLYTSSSCIVSKYHLKPFNDVARRLQPLQRRTFKDLLTNILVLKRTAAKEKNSIKKYYLLTFSSIIAFLKTRLKKSLFYFLHKKAVRVNVDLQGKG
jgi:hypothetical protein